MDAYATQLRQQIERTRAAMATHLDLLQQHVSQRIGATLEETVLAPMRGTSETVRRGTTLLQEMPWLIVGGGIFLGLQLRRGDALPPTSVQRPPELAGAALSSEPPSMPTRTPAVYESAGQPPSQEGGSHSGNEGRGSTVQPETRASLWELGGLRVTELGRRVIGEIQKDDCLGRAAQLAYYFLFALFPFFLFLTTLLGYLPIPNLWDHLLGILGQMLPAEALQLVQDNLRQLVTDQRGGLLSFGILVALWTSSSAVAAIMYSLNLAYDVEEGRPYWKVRGLAMLLTVGLSAFIVVALVLLTFGPQIGGWIAELVGLGGVFELAWNILRWPVIVGLLIVAMALVYYVAPDVEQKWQWITPGSAFAVVGWLLASLGFSFYVNYFGSYNATYGSIGAVIVLLTWMYLTGLFVLIGGEINAEIEHAAQEGKAPGEKKL